LEKVIFFGNFSEVKKIKKKKMIQLLFLVIFAEGVMAFLMLVKIGPLRDLVMKSLDQLKMGKAPATVKTIAGTMFVILLSSLMSIVKIQNKGAKLGTMSPMDQVLWRTHLLEASLLGKFMILSSLSFAFLLVVI
jgi:B-cell receptor-associated protein 31